MGAVLDELQPEFGAEARDRVHVGQVPAHMRQQQDARAGLLRLAPQIREVDHVILVDFDDDGSRPGMDDRAGHRREGKAVDQHRVARLHVQHFQPKKDRTAARIHRDAEAPADEGAEFPLEQRDIILVDTHLAVAEQAP